MSARSHRGAVALGIALAVLPVACLAQGGPAAAMRAACGQELQQFCAGVQPGQGRLVQCLAQRPNELAPSCRALLAQASGPQGGRGPQFGGALQDGPRPAAGGYNGQHTTETIEAGGIQRTFVMVRPATEEPLPTIVMLHGNGGRAAGLPQATGLGPLARREGFVAVFPDGIAHAWNSSPALARLIDQRSGSPPPDDIAFLKALVANLVQRGIADPSRVYLAGFSNGGFMTLRTVCEGVNLFAAVATIEANMPDPIGSSCRPARPVAMMAFSGTGDRKVPYGGGPNRNGVVWSAERGIDLFRRLDGCSDRSAESQLPAPEQQASGVTVLRWTNCAHAPVALYRIEGGVHRIPDAAFTAEALWTFFRDQSRIGMAAAPSGVTPAAVAAPTPDRADVPARAPSMPSPATEEVTFPSNGYMLHGCITRPDGAGPFPTVIYNHGSEKDPAPCGPPALAHAYVERGYLFFAFDRHGHGQSPGDYILDLQKALKDQIPNPAARAERSAALHDDANRDVVGAVQWLMRRPEVDRGRVVMTGVSYGGIQTLLTAEKGLGIRAFIPFAPGAESWANRALQARLAQAVHDAKAPLFLAQAKNDYSLGPSELLGPIIHAKGAPNDAKVYPAFGTTHQQGHGGFAVRGGIPIWSQDVFAFIDAALSNDPARVETPATPAPGRSFRARGAAAHAAGDR